MSKLVATLACRNSGSRLYGKPLQNLDIKEGVTVLDYIVSWLQRFHFIEEIVLGVSYGLDNACYYDFAKKRNIKAIYGDEEDVLARLISCAEASSATDVLRLTTESPFTYYEAVESARKVS